MLALILFVLPLIIAQSSTKANDVIVQLFGWPWESIESECQFLANNGYGYVQTSTAVEHITGNAWWTDYQPVSYNLTSKRGSRAQFSSMVSTCAGLGVDILVDVVLNHMTTSGSGVGIGGSPWSKYNYPIYSPANFHYCDGDGTASEAGDGSDATNYQTCEIEKLLNLADLATETSYVRNTISGLLSDLLSLGVKGFRVDAAKSIADADISAFFKPLTQDFLAVQEVYYGELTASQAAAVEPAAYVSTGKVIEFRYTGTVADYFRGNDGKGIADMVTPTPMGDAWEFTPSDSANAVFCNQDTERNALSLTSADSNYMLGAIFTLAFNYGQPTLYSAFNYTSVDQDAPSSNGLVSAVECGQDGWRCEHRDDRLRRMVPFHNAVKGTSLTAVQSGNSQQIAFGRGSAGYIVINNGDAEWTATFTTDMPEGSYCDVIHSNVVNCSVEISVASDGSFSATVQPNDALAIYVTTSSSPSGYASTSAPASTSEAASAYSGTEVAVVVSSSATSSSTLSSSAARSTRRPSRQNRKHTFRRIS